MSELENLKPILIGCQIKVSQAIYKKHIKFLTMAQRFKVWLSPIKKKEKIT